jgi:hypothetical protein
MQEQTTEEILLRARQQIIEFEENIDDDTLIGMFKKFAIHTIDSHTKLISGLNSLVIKQDDQQQNLCISFKYFYYFLIKFSVAINDILVLIRRQYEEFELEKQNLSFEQTSRKQTFRLELEQLAEEKEYKTQNKISINIFYLF